jgi:RNA polymerase sigma-70 factor (ECF subfamily)
MGEAATRLSEPELADRARQGDAEALDQLYRRHRQALYRHACRMLGDGAAALDMVQEAFARALPAMSRTRPGMFNFRAWIFRIVTNLCLRELDRRGRVRPEADPPQQVAAPAPRELGDQLAAALERLPGRYREILLLRELSELSYAELAEALELSEGNVKVLLHRARARFAAVFIAGRLLAEPATAVSCAALRELLAATPDRRQLERHLEDCPGCRRLEKRTAAELLALLPTPPAVPFPDLPRGAAPAGAEAAGSAATTTTTATTSVSVAALVVGAAVLAVAAIVGVMLVRDLRHRPIAETETVASRRAAANDDRPGESPAASAPSPSATGTGTNKRRRSRSDAAQVPRAMPEGQWRHRRRVDGAQVPLATPKGRWRHERRKTPAVKARIPQAVDPEAPPH